MKFLERATLQNGQFTVHNLQTHYYFLVWEPPALFWAETVQQPLAFRTSSDRLQPPTCCLPCLKNYHFLCCFPLCCSSSVLACASGPWPRAREPTAAGREPLPSSGFPSATFPYYWRKAQAYAKQRNCISCCKCKRQKSGGFSGKSYH